MLSGGGGPCGQPPKSGPKYSPLCSPQCPQGELHKPEACGLPNSPRPVDNVENFWRPTYYRRGRGRTRACAGSHRWRNARAGAARVAAHVRVLVTLMFALLLESWAPLLHLTQMRAHGGTPPPLPRRGASHWRRRRGAPRKAPERRSAVSAAYTQIPRRACTRHLRPAARESRARPPRRRLTLELRSAAGPQRRRQRGACGGRLRRAPGAVKRRRGAGAVDRAARRPVGSIISGPRPAPRRARGRLAGVVGARRRGHFAAAAGV
jgi:hypothetical protein